MATPCFTYESLSREELIRECKNKQAVINHLNAWLNVSDNLPPDAAPVIGYWDNAEYDKLGTLQVCYYDGAYWRTWNCGTFDARLIWPKKWKALVVDADMRPVVDRSQLPQPSEPQEKK